MPKREPLYPHVSKQGSAIEQSAAFQFLKSMRNDVEGLRTTAYLLNSKMRRLIEIVEPYAKYDEYTFLRGLEQSSLKMGSDCRSALTALDALIKRGLIKR